TSLKVLCCFALGSLPEANKERRQTLGKVEAKTHHKQEFFDILAYRFASNPQPAVVFSIPVTFLFAYRFASILIPNKC
ncbi:MAG: hypothetical protein J6T03_03210, partial [Bacteroidales bacterium]|nr:hypothetical protein [Bacteroidales bacterium]